MKKNVVQDVIPPKRSIRNVELLYKSKHAKIKQKETVQEIIRPAQPKILPQNPKPVYKFEYDEPKKRPKKLLYFSVGIFAVAVVFGVMSFFKSAEIRITPKNETGTLDNNFKAQKDITAGGLGYQVVTTVKDVEKVLIATDEQYMEKKAAGRIVVYNNYSSQPQTLVKTTRFSTPEGLIFRAIDDVTVPGNQVKNGKTVAGSVEIVVEADKPGPDYNIGLKDFTVVGLKGTAKYAKIYGRSKTEMTGGFTGMQKAVSKDTVDKTDKELEELLKVSLSRDIISQIPENFVLYPDSISYKLESTVNVNAVSSSDNTATLRKKGSIAAVIFDKGALSRAIVARILPNSVDDAINVTNLENLNFTMASDTPFNPDSSISLDFNLKGQANFVWVYDKEKLKTELLGISKKSAVSIISTYKNIEEAKIKTRPFWNQNIPKDPKKVTIIDTLDK